MVLAAGVEICQHVLRIRPLHAMLAEAHQAACDALTTIPAYTVPQILAGGSRGAAYLMRFAQRGHVLDPVSKTEDHAPLLAPCRWLAARTTGPRAGHTPVSSRTFMVNHLHGGGAYRKSGQRPSMASKAALRLMWTRIADYAQPAQGHAGSIAAKTW